jgi:hypothetical protein
MRRALVAVIAAMPLTFGVAVADAHSTHHKHGGDIFQGVGSQGSVAAVVGTVVSVDATKATIVANAYVLQPPSHEGGGGLPISGLPGIGNLFANGGLLSNLFGNGGLLSNLFSNSGLLSSFFSGGGFHHAGDTPTMTAPTTTQVTITTDSSTKVKINGKTATVPELVAGAKFIALFKGSNSDSIQTLVANPAVAVYARTPRQLYAFVGSVTAVDTKAGTVTVDVTRSLPGSLVPSGSPAAPFTVGPNTLILGGTKLFGGSLSDVSVGDIVAGGLIGQAGQTLTQVEALPLAVLLDLPAPSSASSTAKAKRAEALTKTVALLQSGKKKSHKKHHKTNHKHSHSKKG